MNSVKMEIWKNVAEEGLKKLETLGAYASTQLQQLQQLQQLHFFSLPSFPLSSSSSHKNTNTEE